MKNIFVKIFIIFFVFTTTFLTQVQSAIFPNTPPNGEIQGGYFNRYFDNIFQNGIVCPNGEGIVGFEYNANPTSTYKTDTRRGIPKCAKINSADGNASGFTGSLIGEDGRIPMWANTGKSLTGSVIFQKNKGIGIWTKNPNGLFEVAGPHGANFYTKTNIETRFGIGGENYDIWYESLDNSGFNFLNLNSTGGVTNFEGKVGNNRTNIMSLQNSGNVGIGTTSPTSKLEVSSNNDHSVIQVSTPTNKNPTIWLYHKLANNQRKGWAILNNGLSSNGHGNLLFNYDDRLGTEKSTVVSMTSSGNVGIGTKIPTDKLHITGEYDTQNGGDFKVQVDKYVDPSISIFNRSNNASLNNYFSMGVGTYLGVFTTDAPSGFAWSFGSEYASGSQLDINNGKYTMRLAEKFDFRGYGRENASLMQNPGLFMSGNIILTNNVINNELHNTGSTNGLFFGLTNNSDPIGIYRYNKAFNESELRISIGDDYGTLNDSFSIGGVDWNDQLYKSTLVTYPGKGVVIGNNTSTLHPGAMLQVDGSIRAKSGLPTGTNSAIGYAFDNDSDTGLFRAGNTNGVANSLSMFLENKNALHIIDTNSPKVGIGTDTPSARLDVNGEIIARTNGGNKKIYFGGDTNNNDVELGSIDSSINVLTFWNKALKQRMSINTKNIENEGNIITSNITINNNLTAQNITATNNVTARAYLYSSDKRLKTNIKNITSSLEKILQLRGVEFVWKNNPNKKTFGFIAQEVEKILPELAKE